MSLLAPPASLVPSKRCGEHKKRHVLLLCSCHTGGSQSLQESRSEVQQGGAGTAYSSSHLHLLDGTNTFGWPCMQGKQHFKAKQAPLTLIVGLLRLFAPCDLLELMILETCVMFCYAA